MRTYETGIPGLETVLGGGMPVGSLSLIAGIPGTGKTILANSIAFDQARRGRKVLYFTTISEPHEKMMASLQTLSFFDASKVGTNIELISLYQKMNDADPKSLTDFIASMAKNRNAAIVVIDEIGSLKDIFSSEELKILLFELGARLSAMNVSSILTGAFREKDLRCSSEFTIADLVIYLSPFSKITGKGRRIEIKKARGLGFIPGNQHMTISNKGISIFPQQEAVFPEEQPTISQERVSFGVDILDSVFGGGIPKGSNTLISGSVGTGKTSLAIQYLITGALEKNKCLLVSLRESGDFLTSKANSIGLPLEDQIANGKISVLWVPRSSLQVDQVAETIRNKVQEIGADRIVLDSITEIAQCIYPEKRLVPFMTSLLNYLSARKITSLVISGTDQSLTQASNDSSNIKSIPWDNVISLKTDEQEGQMRRVLIVDKTLFGQKDVSIHRVFLTGEGFTVGR